MTSVSTEFLRFRYRTCCAVRLTGISKRTCIFDSPSSFKIHACARSVLSGTPAHVYTRIRFYDGYPRLLALSMDSTWAIASH